MEKQDQLEKREDQMGEKPQDLMVKSDAKGFAVLLFDWGMLFGVIGLSVWANNLIVYLISVWIIGSFQFSIGEILLHEASHYNLFKTKKLNDKLESLYALPFFVDLVQYRPEHNDHHNKMNTKDDHLVEDYELHGLNKLDKNLFWLWFIKPIVGYAGLFYLRFVISLNPRKSAAKFFTFWGIVVSACWTFDILHILLFYWFVPFLWSFSCFYYWSEIGDHYSTKCGTRSDVSFLTNFFQHNAGYHYVHHEYPAIPWYKLHEAHDAFCPKDTDISTGFIDTYKQMKENQVR